MVRAVLAIGAFLLVVGTAMGLGILSDPEAGPTGRDPTAVREIGVPGPIALVRQARTGCGATPARRWAGGVWRCTFSDEFDGTALDLTRWTLVTTSDSGFSAGIPPAFVCYVNDPRTVSVRGGQLSLSVLAADRDVDCGGPAAQPTRFLGGSVSTKHRFTQTNGRFEIRARFATDRRPGLQSSLILWPDHRTYGGKSGEIDLAEYFTAWPDRVIPYVRYSHPEPDPSVTTDACQVDRPWMFHTYAVQWTPDRIDMTVDGRACLSTDWALGTDPAHPAPFDRPFFLAMFQALGVSKAAFDIEKPAHLPATMQVDYVRIWGPR